MSKHKGKFEDLFEQEVINDTTDVIFEDEESKYWIHRTIAPTLYFNPNYIENDCPMIITQQELDEYISSGKSVVGCTSIDVFYNDEESKRDVIKKLSENGLSLDDLELQLKNKLLEVFKSYFSSGLYMPDVYGTDLERTAHQYSVKKMKRIIGIHNFGFNNYRGEINVGIILEIPLEDQQEIYETLPNPIEYGTEYYGIAKISKVVSPKFIKGMVVKYGDEIFYIQNPNFQKNKMIQDEKVSEQGKELYLYHTEELLEGALQEFITSELPNDQRCKQYIERVAAIEKIYRKYATSVPGFTGSERFKQIYEYLKIIPRFSLYEQDPTKGDFINMQKEKMYYSEIVNQITSYVDDLNHKKRL